MANSAKIHKVPEREREQDYFRKLTVRHQNKIKIRNSKGLNTRGVSKNNFRKVVRSLGASQPNHTNSADESICETQVNENGTIDFKSTGRSGTADEQEHWLTYSIVSLLFCRRWLLGYMINMRIRNTYMRWWYDNLLPCKKSTKCTVDVNCPSTKK